MTTPQPQRPARVPQNRASPTLIGSTPEQVLARAQSGRTVVQDFVPLPDSLEWELGQQYLRDRGNKAFLSDHSPVPYIINNDGTLAHQAADVCFANLVEAEKAGALTPTEDINALELGVGVGLFARFFLDAFRHRCGRAGKNYYDRFCYILADRSPRMLSDLLRYGVMANHPGKYRVRQVDALNPAELLPHDLAFRQHNGQPFRAVFLNYLLDCLPAAVLDFRDEQVRQLHVRTCVARNVQLDEFTDLTARQLAQRADSREPRARQELLEVYGLFGSVYDYRPVDVHSLPHGAFALEARRWTPRLLHSYGALQCLDRLLPLVHPSGFLLLNDYGTDQYRMEGDFEHQRFSLATFVGVNFAQLGDYFQQHRQPACHWVDPGNHGGGIFARLLSHRHLYRTTVEFLTRFGRGERDRLQQPVMAAREWQPRGRFELAAAEYREAVKQQPYN